jgi:hypothetical protein
VLPLRPGGAHRAAALAGADVPEQSAARRLAHAPADTQQVLPKLSTRGDDTVVRRAGPAACRLPGHPGPAPAQLVTFVTRAVVVLSLFITPRLRYSCT